jgi:hypothetical protein
METWRLRHEDIETGEIEKWRHRGGNLIFTKKIKWKTAARAIFLHPFTIYSLCQWKFVVCPFVDKLTNGTYPFANGLNGLAHLCS